jgi:tRNA threonylcarbamoyl adenosine modification protein YeaZ
VCVLGIDTSTATVAVAIGETQRRVTAPNQHGELLAPLIAEVLAEAGIDVSRLAAVGVGLGPGPFTGLRIGIMTAAAMADALGIPAFGVCSLDAVAIQHRGRDLLVMTDARRKQVYWARYGASGTRVEGPDVAAPADVTARFAAAGLLVVGPDEAMPDARWIAAQQENGSSDLTPLYLRRPDARPPGPPKRVSV